MTVLSREAARRDMYAAPRPVALGVGEPGRHAWCPSAADRLLHSYVGKPCSTKPCRCALVGSSVRRAAGFPI